MRPGFRWSLISFTTFAALGATSCKPRSTSQFEEFQNATYGSIRPVDFKLARAEKIAPYEAIVKHLKQEHIPTDERTNSPAELLVLDFIFPKLTSTQFDQLKKAYGGKSEALYRGLSPDRPYRLIDFLPPLAQAVEGKHFIAQQNKIASIQKDLSLDSNCWGTAYEMTRNPKDFFEVFFVFGEVIKPILTNPKYTTFVKTLFASGVNDNPAFEADDVRIRNSDMQPGDLMLISRGAGSEKKLVHVAFFVDDDLYFEKTGPASGHSYRLIDFYNIYRNYSRAPTENKAENLVPLKIEAVVFRPTNTPPPIPSDIFSLTNFGGTGVPSVDDQVAVFKNNFSSELANQVIAASDGGIAMLWQVARVNMIKNLVTGLYVIDERAFDSSFFQVPSR